MYTKDMPNISLSQGFSEFVRALVTEVGDSLSSKRVSFCNPMDDLVETFCRGKSTFFLGKCIVNLIIFLLSAALAYLEHDPCHEAKGNKVTVCYNLENSEPFHHNQTAASLASPRTDSIKNLEENQ
jgi:hypothetical protein